MPTSLGPAEIVVILVVALIVLGPKRLPEAGRQLGKAVAEVRRWSQGVQSEFRQAMDPGAPAPRMPDPAPEPPAFYVPPEPAAPSSEPLYPPPPPPPPATAATPDAAGPEGRSS